MRAADYFFKRVVSALVTVFVAITLNFVIFRVLPGDAVTNLSRVPNGSVQLRQALERQFGLNEPKWQQYLIYLNQLAHGNLGTSFANQRPVIDNLRTDVANTIFMVAFGTVFSILLGVLTGAIAAWRRGSVIDHATMLTSLVFYSVPTQWLGLMLIVLFAGTFPTGGMANDFLLNPTPWQYLTDRALHVALPALTFGLTLYGGYTLIVRSAMLETLGEDYILTARAKGLADWTIVRRHALRNAMLPIVTLVALSLGYMVAGAILVETVFSWPGIGRAVYEAVLERDYPMLQGAFLLLTVSVIFFNLAADLLYFKLDPRVTG